LDYNSNYNTKLRKLSRRFFERGKGRSCEEGIRDQEGRGVMTKLLLILCLAVSPVFVGEGRAIASKIEH